MNIDLDALNESIKRTRDNVGTRTEPYFIQMPYSALDAVARLNVNHGPDINFWANTAPVTTTTNKWDDLSIESIEKSILESHKAFEEAPVPSFELFKQTFDIIEKIDNENIDTLRKLGDSIHALRTLIDNVDKLAEGKDVTYESINGVPATLRPEQGLCDNCFNNRINNTAVTNMFKSWEHYSGYDIYPVGGRAEYYCKKNLYSNPKRIQLAKFCLQQLTNELNKYTIVTYPRGK